MTVTGLYIDLLITDNDLTLDQGGEPTLVANRPSVAQDIKHLIRESGLLVRCVGERDPVKVQDLLQQLVLLIEEDVRLVPGTVAIERQGTGLFYVTADTVDYGKVGFEATTL